MTWLFSFVRACLIVCGVLFLGIIISAPADAFDAKTLLKERHPKSAQILLSNQAWFPLGFGVDGVVSTVATSGTDLYVGGIFWNACGNPTCDNGNIPVNYIAKWDGSSWSSLGYGLDGNVFAIVVNGSDVYVGGVFTNACGAPGCGSGNIPVNHIAKWNGTTWSAVGNGFDSAVFALAVSGSEVYVGGAFTYLCGNTACDTNNQVVNRMARWNGTNWVSIGKGVNNHVLAIDVAGTDVYFGGGFQYLCNVDCSSANTTVNFITKWDGTQLMPLGAGLNGAVSAIAVDSSNVYLGGSFDAICGDTSCGNLNTIANHIAKWNGSNYETVGNGLGDVVSDLTIDGSKLYAGGSFTIACASSACSNTSPTANHIAVWDANSWSNVEYGMNDSVATLALSNGHLFAGGMFQNVCGDISCVMRNRTMNSVADYHTCTSAPTQAILKSPKSSGVTRKSKPTLKWIAAPCAETYDVTIRDAATRKNVEKVNGLLTLQYKTTKTLAKGRTYKWFVQACNTYGCTKSDIWKFTIQ